MPKGRSFHRRRRRRDDPDPGRHLLPDRAQAYTDKERSRRASGPSPSRRDANRRTVPRTMRVVLAEKPSVARELAAFLGAVEKRDGYFEGRGDRVTWALGHLVTLKEPQDYDPALKKWTLDSLPIVPERFGLKPLDEGGSGKQLAVIRRLFRDADELVCATDAGREGELIFRFILEWAGCVGKPSRRLWLNSLTREAIRDAFGRLRPLSDYDDLYAAARCRSEADWVVGLNATRYLHRQASRGRAALERRPGADARPRHDRPPRRRDPHLQARTVLGTDDRSIGQDPASSSPAIDSPERRARRMTFLARVRRAAVRDPRASSSKPERIPPPQLARPDRTPARHEPSLRDVGRRDPQGRAIALRIQAPHLSAHRFAPPDAPT